ncbi:MAG: BrnA antitoxin family protein [Geminicoccaceae bacterium]|nr:BrnA antitoxin family protein [Geminicoccaceae bacterium]
MSHEEAVCRRHADPEAPRPYPGWEKAAPAHMPRPKDRLTLRVDADVVEWFKRQGQGYQTRMNAALRAFMDAHGHGS